MQQIPFEKFQPIDLMTTIVLGELSRVSVVDKGSYASLYADLVKFALLERFHFINVPSQLEQMWNQVRVNEDLLDLITRSLISFKFQINCPAMLEERTITDHYSETLLPLLSTSITTLCPEDHGAETVMDATMSDRLAKNDEFLEILRGNQWLVVLILLSMSTKFIVGGQSTAVGPQR